MKQARGFLFHVKHIALSCTGSIDGAVTLSGSLLLVPVVSFADVVVNGHRVDLEEFHPPDWQGYPVYLRHPPELLSGRALEAWEEKNTLGRIIRSEIKGDSFTQLLAIDYPTTNPDAVDVVESLKNSDRVEVSLGFYGIATPAEGEYKGRAYEDTVSELRPWHLAILPDEVGACSIADGCGTYYNSARLADRARHPSYSGVSDAAWRAPTLADYLSGFNAAHSEDDEDVPTDTPFGDLSDGQKEWIAELTLLGQKSALSFEDLTLLPVVDPATLELNRNALDAAIEFASGEPGIEALGEARAESAAGEATALLVVFEEELEATTLTKKTWLKKVTLEHSLTDVTSAVAGAVWDKFASDRNNIWPQVLDIFEDRVRFAIDDAVFEAAYSINDESVVTLEDEVKGDLEFVPIAATSIKSALDAMTKKLGALLTGNTKDEGRATAPEENSMKDKLIALGLSAEVVETWSECKQKAVLAAMEGEAPAPKPVKNSSDPTDDKTPTIAEQVAEGVATAVAELVPEAVSVALAADRAKASREANAARLREHGYSDENIESMNDEAVLLVAGRLPAPNFSAAAPYLNAEDDSEDLPARRVTITPVAA